MHTLLRAICYRPVVALVALACAVPLLAMQAAPPEERVSTPKSEVKQGKPTEVRFSRPSLDGVVSVPTEFRLFQRMGGGGASGGAGSPGSPDAQVGPQAGKPGAGMGRANTGRASRLVRTTTANPSEGSPVTPAGSPSAGTAGARRTMIMGGGPDGGDPRPTRLGDSEMATRPGSIMNARPEPPGAVAITEVSGAVITIEWTDQSANETGFTIEHQVRSGSTWVGAGTYTVSAGRETAQFTVDPGTHRFRVAAVSDGGSSRWTSWSASVEVNSGGTPPPPAAPAAPANFSAVQSESSTTVILRWDDMSGNESGFEIERNPGFSAGTRTVGENVAMTTDVVTPGTFQYRVRSYNAEGASMYTAWRQVVVTYTPPAPPTSLTARDALNERDITVQWTDESDNEERFVLERERQVGSFWGESTIVELPANTTEYTDPTGLGTFRYRIASGNNIGNSAFTSWSSATVSASGGWTEFTPSSDTRIVYVSSSEGNDTNDGLSPERPKRTIAAGYALLRNGYPDWMLMKRGDVWNGESFTGASAWNKSGRSESERILLGAYGEGDRPVVQPVGATDGWAVGSQGSGTRLNHIAIVGIKFLNTTWSGNNGTAFPAGINWLRTGTDLLVEDCHIEGFCNNVMIQGYPSPGLDQLIFRRNILANPLRTDAGNTNMYVDRSSSFLIEDNLFYQTLDNEIERGNKLSHNLYLHESNGLGSGNVIRGNILYNARSNLTARMSANVTNNLAIRGGLGITLGHDSVPSPVPFVGTLVNNVVTESRNHWNGQDLGWAIDLRNVASLAASQNLVFGPSDGRSHAGIAISNTVRDVEFIENILYDWKDAGSANNIPALVVFTQPTGPVVFQDNIFSQPVENWIVKSYQGNGLAGVSFSGNQYGAAIVSPFIVVGLRSYSLQEWRSNFDASARLGVPSFPDPLRTVGRYAEVVRGAVGSTESLVQEAAEQRRGNWDSRLTSESIISWLKEGFSR